MTLLVVFGGLPGTGKTALAKALAQKIKATYLRIDTIEQALKTDGAEGYIAAYAIAEDNLRTGNSVVSDGVNPVPATRMAWRGIAASAGVRIMEVEIVCSDADEHKRRVETRKADIEGHKLPTWEDVISREYHPWSSKDVTIDTAGKTQEEALAELMRHIPKPEKEDQST